MAETWNQDTSKKLKKLKAIPVNQLTDAQKSKIWALEDLKTAAGKTVGSPLPGRPVTPTTPTTPAPGADTPAGESNTGNSPLSDKINTNATGLTETDASSIERAKAILGIGETFGRGIADEFYSDGSLGRLAEANTPEELAALEQAKLYASNVGNQTDAVRAILQQQQGILGNAQNLSPLELEALQVARSNLQGLASPEMEALRFAARQNIVGAQQAGLRDLAKTQARNQVFGSAATAQRNLFGQAGVREGRNLERDLLVKNIEIKQAAQNAFSGLATNTEANRASRTSAASGLLANTTLNDEAQRNAAKGNAINSQAGIANSLGNTLRGLQQYNLGQVAAEKAGQVGSIFGGIGTISDQRGLLAGEDFADKQLTDSQAVQDRILEILKQSMSKQAA